MGTSGRPSGKSPRLVPWSFYRQAHLSTLPGMGVPGLWVWIEGRAGIWRRTGPTWLGDRAVARGCPFRESSFVHRSVVGLGWLT